MSFLALLVLADLLVVTHPYFGIDGSFGFYAWYRFATCAAMVIGARALKVFLKRQDTYYDNDEKGGGNNND